MDQQTTKRTQEKSRPTGGERLVKQDTGGNAEAEVVLYQPDSSIHIEVLVEGETVWLTQQQIAQLFDKSISVISRHISNIIKDGELDEKSNLQKMQIANSDKPVVFYNLDMIISIGYRCSGQRATRFRIWATSILKQHLLQGYTINRQLIAFQQHVDERFVRIEDRLRRNEEQIDFFVRTNQPPHEGVVFEGHLLEGREVAESLIKRAKREVILIDAYVGADTFHILEVREAGVAATIYTEKTGANIQALQRDYEREYGVERHIEVKRYRTSFHDRFLLIDEDVYHIGASLKDLCKRLFAFDKMGLPKALILSQVR